MDSIITNCSIAVVRPAPLDNYNHKYTQKIMELNGYKTDEKNYVAYLLVRLNSVFRAIKRTAITNITAGDIRAPCRRLEQWYSPLYCYWYYIIQPVLLTLHRKKMICIAGVTQVGCVESTLGTK